MIDCQQFKYFREKMINKINSPKGDEVLSFAPNSQDGVLNFTQTTNETFGAKEVPKPSNEEMSGWDITSKIPGKY